MKMRATVAWQPTRNLRGLMSVVKTTGPNGRKEIGQPQNPSGPNPCTPRHRVHLFVVLKGKSFKSMSVSATETWEGGDCVVWGESIAVLLAPHRDGVSAMKESGTSRSKVIGQPQNPTGPNPCVPRPRAHLGFMQEG